MFINMHLIRFLRGVKGRFLWITVLNLLITLSSSCVLLLTAILVDAFSNGKGIRLFSSFMETYGCIIGCLITGFLLFKVRTVYTEKTAIIIKDNVRCQLLQKLFLLGPAYTLKSRTGALASTLTSKVESLKFYYANYLPVALATIINAAIFLMALFIIDSVSGTVALISCICMLAAPMCFYRSMKGLGKNEWDARAGYYSDCLDGIQGISTLKALNANRLQIKRIKEQGEKLRRAVMTHLKVTMTEGAVLELFARIGSSITVTIVAFRHISGEIPSEATIFAYFFAAACFTPMLGLINAWHLGFQGVSASYSIIELLNESTANSVRNESLGVFLSKEELEESLRKNIQMSFGGEKNSDFTGDICLKNIFFSYAPKDGEVIHNLNLTLKEGTMTAIVGRSGSGKSTLAHLIAGFYTADHGTIDVGGITIEKDNISAFQDQISAVWQDSHLFYGTIYENILLGDPEASDEEVYQAAKNANLHDFVVSLPEGYETVIGERGMRFSGGERQRIAIARAYLRNSSILLFDEATSSLDMKNEMDIQNSFLRLSRKKTSLVIAHRMSTVIQADQICVLQNGRIAAVGIHKELAENADIYKQIMREQLTDNV